MIKNDIIYGKCSDCMEIDEEYIEHKCIHMDFDLKVVGCIRGADQIKIGKEDIINEI